MEETLWFALGSLAGVMLSGRGRPLLLRFATAAIRAGGSVSGAASRAANRFSALTAEQRETVSQFVAEARSRARSEGQAPEERPTGEAEPLAPA
jgi:hypothetical protein